MKAWLRARKSIVVREFLLVAVVAITASPSLLLGQGAPPSQTGSQATPKAVVFEVASVKPSESGERGIRIMFRENGLSATNVPLKTLISEAYGIREDLISGEPGWVDTARYDIDAKFDDSLAEETKKLPRQQQSAQMKSAIQSLLVDRFNLKVSRPTKELPIYALVIAKSGFKLKPASPGETYANGIKGPDGRPAGAGLMMMGRSQITGQGISIASLVEVLSRLLTRTIVDKTGLTAKYDISLKWVPDEFQGAMFPGPGPGPGPGPAPASAPSADTSGPSLFTALEEQLGLKLESTKGPVETLVIDHVEPPSEN